MNKLRLFINIPLSLEAAREKSKQPFISTITYAGRLSDRYVGGTEHVEGGPYRVFIPAQLMRDKISELEGKGIFAAENLRSHPHSDVDGGIVGEFVSTWVETADDEKGGVVLAAKASGFFDRDKDKDLVDEITALARQGKLGVSYDLKEVQFELNAESVKGETVMEVSNFKWRGATVLMREAAAYEFTQLAASKSKPDEGKEKEMTQEEILKAVTDGTKVVFDEYRKNTLDPFKAELQASISQLTQDVSELKGKAALEAAKSGSAPAKTEPTKPDGDTLSLEVFVTTIKEAIALANTPVVQAITDLKASLPAKADPTNKRRSSGPEIELVAKYSGQAFDENDPTVQDFEKSIRTVQEDTAMRPAEKDAVLASLGAAKRRLMRAVQTSQGGGGYAS